MTADEKRELQRLRSVATVALWLSFLCAVILLSHVIHDALAFSELHERLEARQ